MRLMPLALAARFPALVAAFAVTFALALAACGGGISEDEFRTELTDSGLTADQANCIIDGLGDVGIPLEDVTDQALGDADPPQEVIDITIACVAG